MAGAEGISARIILCGHTHVPRVIRLRDGRMIVNPGSVGLPGYDGQAPVSYVVEVGTPHACYAILERTKGGWSATIRYIPSTTRSERTYRCRRTRRFGVMCPEQGACVRRRSWAGYTIDMFEFEFPTGQPGLAAKPIIDLMPLIDDLVTLTANAGA
jgi:diadenosine tetraphosphatase ApaH/serine/threonine PP2A family protein phosphatase